MTLSNSGIISSNVVGLWYKQPQFLDIIQQLKAAVLDDCHVTIRQLTHDVKIGMWSVEKIIHDHLHMKQMSA